MKKSLLLFIVFSLCTSVFAFAASSTLVTNNANHWSHQNLQNGVNEQFVTHISDDVDIDAKISKSDFLIMLQKGVGLLPNSSIANFLAQNSENKQNQNNFTDVSGHKIVSEGYLKVALDFGIIQSSEYQNRNFDPDGSITREDAVVWAVRSLGLKYPAEQYNGKDKPFIDWNSLPESIKGFAEELVLTDILKGYPTGDVKLEWDLTYAEATALVDRTRNEMLKGLDSGIKVVKTETYNNADGEVTTIVSDKKIDLPVPIQKIGDEYYFPLRFLYEKFDNISYNPLNFEMIYTLKGWKYSVQAGNGSITQYTDKQGMQNAVFALPAAVRIQNGEIMIPLNYYAKPISYDEATKTLNITVFTKYKSNGPSGS